MAAQRWGTGGSQKGWIGDKGGSPNGSMEMKGVLKMLNEAQGGSPKDSMEMGFLGVPKRPNGVQRGGILKRQHGDWALLCPQRAA